MATFNLVRNSRVFFTTNVDSNSGVVVTTGATINNTNTFELQVLDGFSFSQATNADTVTINEAGNNPVRGQRSFNTSLGTVEFSFSTYLRPAKVSTTVTAEESVLWNALLSDTAISATPAATLAGTTITAAYVAATNILTLSGTGMTFAGIAAGDIVVIQGVVGANANQFNTAVKVLTLSGTSCTFAYIAGPTSACPAAGFASNIKFFKSAWTTNVADGTDTGYTSAYSQVTSAVSNKNQLQKFGMYFVVDNAMYAIDNCAMDQASVDFGLDGIATVAWTGKGTALRALPTTAIITGSPAVFSGAGNATGTALAKYTGAGYITNKLSTLTLIKNTGGQGDGNKTYTLALTGGNITIANNITYLTPSNLGVVNTPIGYFTSTRAISGSINAYLRTGTTNSAGLLSDLLAASATAAGVEPKFKMQVEVGGATNATRVEMLMDGAMLQIPTINAEAVMSTTINFTAQGTDAYFTNNQFDIENTNDLRIRYFSATTV